MPNTQVLCPGCEDHFLVEDEGRLICPDFAARNARADKDLAQAAEAMRLHRAQCSACQTGAVCTWGDW
jgi:hypothetical protein